jgi:hypothetical protein
MEEHTYTPDFSAYILSDELRYIKLSKPGSKFSAEEVQKTKEREAKKQAKADEANRAPISAAETADGAGSGVFAGSGGGKLRRHRGNLTKRRGDPYLADLTEEEVAGLMFSEDGQDNV